MPTPKVVGALRVPCLKMKRMLKRMLLAALVMALALVPVAADDKAPDPAGEHRAFRPVARPQPPTVRGAARTDIDRFILAALEAKRLALSPEADRATLIRRVAFDLIG